MSKEQTPKKRVFSAIKPTGGLTIGNYLGALVNMRRLADTCQCMYAVADLHSLTVDNVPADLRNNSYQLFAMYLACGLDTPDTTLFVQSHVPAHAELTWILNCYTQFGEASRMTQFKEKSARHKHNVNVGLFDYPVLMAADILLYQAEQVPVGDDQRQHLELARTIAERFNNRYTPTFAVPEGIVNKTAARIYSLADPTVKMGKTDDNVNAYVLMTDDADTIRRKISRAVTDSGSQIVAAKDKPGITNLLNIYAAFVGRSVAEAEQENSGLTYAQFKERVAEAVIAGLQPIRAEYLRLVGDRGYLDEVMLRGRQAAMRIAHGTLSKVYRKVGLVAPIVSK